MSIVTKHFANMLSLKAENKICPIFEPKKLICIQVGYAEKGEGMFLQINSHKKKSIDVNTAEVVQSQRTCNEKSY